MLMILNLILPALSRRTGLAPRRRTSIASVG